MPDAPEWLRVDLGALSSVSRVRLSWENNGRSYVVETSTDGTTWQPATRTSAGTNGLTFPAVSARFVRVTGTLRVNQYGSRSTSCKCLPTAAVPTWPSTSRPPRRAWSARRGAAP